MANPAGNVRLFEVNLIGDRVKGIFRRRAYQQWSAVASVAMLAAGAVMASFVVMHMTAVFGVRTGLKRISQELEERQRTCQQLDELKTVSIARIEAIAPLFPLAGVRLAWAPKLIALADALPPGTGLVLVRATDETLSAAIESVTKDPAAKAAASQKKALPAQMYMAILYAPSTGGEGSPIAFLERLHNSEAFMHKLRPDSVRLEATEQDSWRGVPVMILRSSAQGGPAN